MRIRLTPPPSLSAKSALPQPPGCLSVVPQPVYMNMSDLSALSTTTTQPQMMMTMVMEESPDLKTPTAEDQGGLGSDGSGSSSGYGSQIMAEPPPEGKELDIAAIFFPPWERKDDFLAPPLHVASASVCAIVLVFLGKKILTFLMQCDARV